MGDENKEGESNQEELKKILENDLVKKAIDDAVKEATNGLETNRDTILAEKRELAEQLKSANETAKQFEGLDVNKIKTMIDSMDKSEEAKLIAEGKIDDVIRARTESVKNAYEAQFADKDTEIKTLADEKTAIQKMYESKLIGDAIRSEAIAEGVLPEAVEDVIKRAEGLFKIGENGVEASKVDEFINSPQRFVKSLKEVVPHYWPANADFRLSGSGGANSKDIGERMEAAAASGDFEAYKALRDKQTGRSAKK